MEPKILLAVPTATMAREAEFYDYLNILQTPPNTVKSSAHGQSPARNRNLMISQALEHDCSHIMFIDDDVAFRPDLLMRLLAHDVDIVTGLYPMRNYPHQPIIFDYADEHGRCLYHYPSSNSSGLVEIVGCGLGACLIKIGVFKAIEKPWIRLGELEPDHWCDDLGFFRRVRAAGFKLYCDLDATVFHFGTVKIGLEKMDGQWCVVYDTNGTSRVSFPMYVPTPKEAQEAADDIDRANRINQ